MEASSLINKISDLASQADEKALKIDNFADLESFYEIFLGKKSELQTCLKSLKALENEAKREVGPEIQAFKQKWEQFFRTKKAELELEALNKKLASEKLDVTKSKEITKGALHPISLIQRKVENIFTSMGFEIADGPEVETEWHNFEALNIPDTHPARDMQDTFFVSTGAEDAKENVVLRTHTSSVQIRKMLEKGVPVKVIAPGRVYRNEDVDATHDASFYQVEGLLVDENISVADFKGIVEKMLSEVFEKPITVRIRPGYFPFVEPGLEIDIWWEYKNAEGKTVGRWLEFMGAGMVHPNVLKNCGVDPQKYSGFAFGFGLTRLVMMKYGIEDIRLLFSHKKEFLQQF